MSSAAVVIGALRVNSVIGGICLPNHNLESATQETIRVFPGCYISCFIWFGLMLHVPVNSYGHVGMVPHFFPGQA